MKYIGNDIGFDVRNDVCNAFDYEVGGRVISRVMVRLWNDVAEEVRDDVGDRVIKEWCRL